MVSLDGSVRDNLARKWLSEHVGKRVQLMYAGGASSTGLLRAHDDDWLWIADDAGHVGCVTAQGIVAYLEPSPIAKPNGMVPKGRG